MRARPPRRCRFAGFSFVEVLFAVVLLGLGFILIAAVFPVAIGQTRQTVDEAHAAAVGRSAIAYLATVLPRDLDTGGALNSFDQLGPEVVTAIRGQQIDPADARYAWVPAVAGDKSNGMSFARVVVFVVACRNRPAYGPVDLQQNLGGSSLPATLDARPVKVEVIASSAGGSIRFPDAVPAIPAADATHAVAPGAFVVIANDKNDPDHIGRAFRVGPLISVSASQGSTWSLDPTTPATAAADAVPPPPSAPNAYVVGRGYLDPANPAAGYGGDAQDVTVLSSYVSLR